jgi:large subunit ribosomal protein L29
VPKLKERQQQICALSQQEAQKMLRELRLKLFNLHLQLQRGEVKNVCLLKQTRKDIARLLEYLGRLERE